MINKAKYLVILSPIIWGINPTAMKIANRYLTATTTTFFRLFIALIIMTTAAVISRNLTKENIITVLKDTKFMMLYFTIFQFFFGLGISMLPASISSVVFGMFPVVMVLITTLLGYEKANIKIIISILLSVIGVSIIIFSGNTSEINSISKAGVIFILLAEVGYAFFTIQSKQVSKKHPPIAVTAASIFVTTLVFLILSFNNLMTITITELPSEAWLALLFCGAFAIGFANMVWIWGAKYLKSNTQALYSNVSPIAGIITGFIVLDERITLMQSIGTLIIFTSILLSQTKGKENANKSLQLPKKMLEYISNLRD